MKKNEVFLFAIITLSIALVNCNKDGVASNKNMKDNKAVPVINNPGIPQNSTREFFLQQEISIGDIDNNNTFFIEVDDMDVDDKGDIYVLETKSMEVRVFDKYGTFKNKFGRRGEGPGEFILPSDLMVDDRKDLIYISDWKNKKISIFHETGTLDSEIKLKKSPSALAINKDGNYMVAFTVFEKKKDTYYNYINIHTLDNDGDTINKSPDFLEGVMKNIMLNNSSGVTFSMPFNPKGLFYYKNFGDFFYYTFPDNEYAITVFNSKFDKIRIIKKQNPFIKEISKDKRDEYINAYIEQGEARKKGDIYRMTVKYLEFPKFFPLIYALWEMDDGNLLVKSPSPDNRVKIDVFDKNGIYIEQWIVNNPTASVSADSILNAQAIFKNKCIYNYITEGDTLFIVKYRLIEKQQPNAKQTELDGLKSQ